VEHCGDNDAELPLGFVSLLTVVIEQGEELRQGCKGKGASLITPSCVRLQPYNTLPRSTCVQWTASTWSRFRQLVQ
jgi:hypothetical protein